MKWLIFIVVFVSQLAHAENVSLTFKATPILDFAEATYKVMLNRDYIITPDVLGLDKRITINIKSIEKDKLQGFLSDLLKSVGVNVRETSGIFRLEKIAPESNQIITNSANTPASPPPQNIPIESFRPEIEDFEIYKPINRTVEYLQSVVLGAGVSLGQHQGKTAQDVIVISGSEERRKKILNLLKQIDYKPSVLDVRAALVEFTDSEEDSISLGAILDLLSGKLNIAISAGKTSGENYIRFKNNSIDAILRALNGDSRFRFRSEPSIRLVDGEKGRLMVGSEVPVRGAMTLSNDGTPIQSIEYRSSGLVLSVLPRVLQGRVMAQITQEVSSFSTTSTSNIDSPTLNKRQIETVIDADRNEIVLLAGLDEESTTESSSSFFFFPTSKSKNVRKTQILVFLEFNIID